MDLKRFTPGEAFEAQVLLVLAALGALLVGLGILSLVQTLRKTGTLHSRPGYSVVVLTLLGLALAGSAVWRRVPLLEAVRGVIQRDQENAAELAALRTAPLSQSDVADLPAGDWPEWRGPHRDGISVETGLRTDWTTPPPTLWKRELGSGYSSVAVVGGRLYTMEKKGNEERVICMEAATGKEMWAHAYAVNYGGLSYGAGPRATPTVHDGRVYTVGATGIFTSLDAMPSDGKAHVLWQHDLLTEFNAPRPTWGVACSALIEGDLVCVQPGGKKSSVVAFDRRTGAEVWRALSDISGYSSPVAATVAGVRQIVCFTGLGAAGLSAADGNQLWYYPWSTSNNGNIATTIVAGDYVFISSAYGAGCALLHLKGGANGKVDLEPVYVKHNKLMRNHHSSCVLRDGYLYGFDDGTLKCVDLRRGEEKWSARGIDKGCVLYADGHLVVLSENGTLALVEASPEQFREKGRIRALLKGSDCWSLPTLSNGRLYLRDHQQMICLDLRK